MASEIVVGIDFGTTHSGVSWAVNGGTKTVHLIDDWPDPMSKIANSEKVPTVISYKDGQPHSWGNDVGMAEQNSFKWFKILLDPKHKMAHTTEQVVASGELLSSLNKSAEDVAADYLQLVWQYTTDDIQQRKGDNWRSTYSLKIVLTVPAIWSDVAKDKTKKVAMKAGLPSDISLVSEPEAAALAVLKDKNEDNDLHPGDAFVVCDAGGGTVDLISYKVTNTDPLQVEECAVGDGGLCGSAFLDAAFERHVKTLVGEEEYAKIRPKAKKRMLSDFEQYIKRCYTGENKEYSVDLRGVQDNPAEGIEDDTIKLKYSVLKTVFDHVINQIIHLVEKQICQVRDKGLHVKAILLVGGFGSNKYMHQRLKDAHRRDGIQVLKPNGAWSAICRGATIWGLENSENSKYTRKTVAARIARNSYGYSCAKAFSSAEGHLSIDRRRSASGAWLAVDQMGWFIRKGDRIEQGKIFQESLSAEVQVGFFDVGVHRFSDTLYYCADDVPPSRMEAGVKELCMVEYGIKKSALKSETAWRSPESGEKWRDAVFTIAIFLDSAQLHFAVFYKGEAVAYSQAKYLEDF